MDSRRYLRFKIPLAVDLVDRQDGQVLHGTSSDFSRQGFAIALQNGRTPSSLDVDFELRLPSQENPVLGRGRVAWTGLQDNRNCVGIEIQEIDKEAKSEVLQTAYQAWRAHI